jgi:radical SAM protein with 4Fe4S-binding SPASM domain
MCLRLRRWWTVNQPTNEQGFSGLHHYVYQSGDERSRIHLRVDPDGSGALIINAGRILHLNPMAVLMAYSILEGDIDKVTLRLIQRKYHADKKLVQVDLDQFRSKLAELIRPEGACPIHELDLDVLAPFTAPPRAPYRMDLAITYRCNNDCAHCYNERNRSYPELPASEWKKILIGLWQLGIPHIIFTGGEPTLRNDLPELIAQAESIGQITGVNTNGRRLSNPSYSNLLVESGLDHVQITVESSNEFVHDQMVRSNGAFKQTIQGLKNALGSRLFVMTNTTMLRSNLSTIPETLDFLADLGVPTIGLNALIHSGEGKKVGTGLKEEELQELLEVALKKTEAHGQRLIWYTPTQYCRFDPTLSNLGVKGCTAALYSMCIESNGDVIPCQSTYRPLGNIQTDAWESIWNHPISRQLRERQDLPIKCKGCPIVSECGGGCPLKFEMEPAGSMEYTA